MSLPETRRINQQWLVTLKINCQCDEDFFRYKWQHKPEYYPLSTWKWEELKMILRGREKKRNLKFIFIYKYFVWVQLIKMNWQFMEKVMWMLITMENYSEIELTYKADCQWRQGVGKFCVVRFGSQNFWIRPWIVWEY